MAKSYTRQLNEWVKQTGHSSKPDRNRVAFLAVKEDVREALEEGWSVKTIWTHMVEQERIGFGYDTFLAYVNRHVRASADPTAASAGRRPPTRLNDPQGQPPRAPKEAITPDRSVPATPYAPEPMSGFTFNAAPNREELI